MDRPQDPTGVSVSVVIPCRNEAGTITLLLDAIEQQDLRPLEVIIVDDASTDASREVVGRWAQSRRSPRIELVEGPGAGPAAAMNAGISRARGEIVLRLDGHCLPRPDYLRRAVRTLFDFDAGVVGGVWEIEPNAGTLVASAIAAVTAHPLGTGGVAYRNWSAPPGTTRPVDTVPFGCFSRSLWEQLGGFDEALAANEDYDFNHRARLAGRPVLINTDIRSKYRSRATLRALGRQYFRYGFWKTQMLRKSPRALALRQVPPALLLPWLGTTVFAAAVATGLPTLLSAALYPALVTTAGVQIALGRRDLRIFAPVFAALVVQHAAWSAGFWHGWVWPPSRAT